MGNSSSNDGGKSKNKNKNKPKASSAPAPLRAALSSDDAVREPPTLHAVRSVPNAASALSLPLDQPHTMHGGKVSSLSPSSASASASTSATDTAAHAYLLSLIDASAGTTSSLDIIDAASSSSSSHSSQLPPRGQDPLLVGTASMSSVRIGEDDEHQPHAQAHNAGHKKNVQSHNHLPMSSPGFRAQNSTDSTASLFVSSNSVVLPPGSSKPPHNLSASLEAEEDGVQASTKGSSKASALSSVASAQYGWISASSGSGAMDSSSSQGPFSFSSSSSSSSSSPASSSPTSRSAVGKQVDQHPSISSPYSPGYTDVSDIDRISTMDSVRSSGGGGYSLPPSTSATSTWLVAEGSSSVLHKAASSASSSSSSFSAASRGNGSGSNNGSNSGSGSGSGGASSNGLEALSGLVFPPILKELVPSAEVLAAFAAQRVSQPSPLPWGSSAFSSSSSSSSSSIPGSAVPSPVPSPALHPLLPPSSTSTSSSSSSSSSASSSSLPPLTDFPPSSASSSGPETVISMVGAASSTTTSVLSVSSHQLLSLPPRCPSPASSCVSFQSWAPSESIAPTAVAMETSFTAAALSFTGASAPTESKTAASDGGLLSASDSLSSSSGWLNKPAPAPPLLTTSTSNTSLADSDCGSNSSSSGGGFSVTVESPTQTSAAFAPEGRSDGLAPLGSLSPIQESVSASTISTSSPSMMSKGLTPITQGATKSAAEGSTSLSMSIPTASESMKPQLSPRSGDQHLPQAQQHSHRHGSRPNFLSELAALAATSAEEARKLAISCGAVSEASYEVPQFPPRVMFLMRGVSGSGKSSAAKRLKGEHGELHSADQHFMRPDGTYAFDPSQLGSAHKNCQQNAFASMKRQVPVVVIDNTNIAKWEARPYIEAALRYGYRIVVAESGAPWARDAAACSQQNVHGVPQKKIEEMLRKFQTDFTIESVLVATTQYGSSMSNNNSSSSSTGSHRSRWSVTSDATVAAGAAAATGSAGGRDSYRDSFRDSGRESYRDSQRDSTRESYRDSSGKHFNYNSNSNTNGPNVSQQSSRNHSGRNSWQRGNNTSTNASNSNPSYSKTNRMSGGPPRSNEEPVGSMSSSSAIASPLAPSRQNSVVGGSGEWQAHQNSRSRQSSRRYTSFASSNGVVRSEETDSASGNQESMMSYLSTPASSDLTTASSQAGTVPNANQIPVFRVHQQRTNVGNAESRRIGLPHLGGDSATAQLTQRMEQNKSSVILRSLDRTTGELNTD